MQTKTHILNINAIKNERLVKTRCSFLIWLNEFQIRLNINNERFVTTRCLFSYKLFGVPRCRKGSIRSWACACYPHAPPLSIVATTITVRLLKARSPSPKRVQLPSISVLSYVSSMIGLPLPLPQPRLAVSQAVCKTILLCAAILEDPQQKRASSRRDAHAEGPRGFETSSTS